MATTSYVKEQLTSPYWDDIGEEAEEEASCLAVAVLADSLKVRVLQAVIDLGILEIIKKCGPGAHMSLAQIAAELPITGNLEHAVEMLGRMLNYLVSHSILTVVVNPVIQHIGATTVERRYGLAPVCKFLTPNEDGFCFCPTNNDAMLKSWLDCTMCLKDAVLEGAKPFTKAYGMTLFEYIGKHPEYQKSFHNTMSDNSTLTLKKILRNYKGFEGLTSIVDVGGGSGTTLSLICSQYPSIKGINFDQPHVVANAPPCPGVEHVGGDMFESIPKGDAIILKWICHCFSDEECIRILKNCYAAIPEKHGKVIICEYLLPDASEAVIDTIAGKSVMGMDLVMMLLPGGKERSKEEFEALAMEAGFQCFQVACSAYNVKVMELLK